MRITSTNINGLSDIMEYSQYILGNVQFESDVHCYQEINLDMSQPEVVRNLQTVVNQMDCSKGDAIITSSSPSESRNSIKKQGGTIIHMAFSDWLSIQQNIQQTWQLE